MVSSEIRAESTGVLQLDFQLTYSTLTSIIVRWYHWVFKEIEDVVTAFYQTLFECFKLLAKTADIQFEQVV